MLEVVENLVDLPLGELADGDGLEDLGEADWAEVGGLPLLLVTLTYIQNSNYFSLKFLYLIDFFKYRYRYRSQ
jgi:hypothetical protein